MATPQTRHQKSIINRYYEHHDTIQSNKLAETVSELYLADSDRKRKALWDRAANALRRLGVDPQRVDAVVEAGDIETLAKLVKQADAGQAPGQQPS